MLSSPFGLVVGVPSLDSCCVFVGLLLLFCLLDSDLVDAESLDGLVCCARFRRRRPIVSWKYSLNSDSSLDESMSIVG